MKRYTIQEPEYFASESADGEWVRYEDVAEIQQELKHSLVEALAMVGEGNASYLTLMSAYMELKAQLAKQEQAHESFLGQIEAELSDGKPWPDRDPPPTWPPEKPE